MAVAFLQHPSSLEHVTGRHPERPERVLAVRAELDRRGWHGLRRLESAPAPRSALEAVHAPAHLDRIVAMCAGGGGHLDLDTVLSERSYEAALHGAGGAVQLVEMLLSSEVAYGFSAHRPPGHHATADRAMGFCLLNSVAVAARHALDTCGRERVLIVDWDVHHGNGTNDIFHATDGVLFVSIHQSPLYPGTGPARDAGEGAGTGYTVNLPVGPGAGDAVFLSLLEHVVEPLASSFEPELVLVSAGYDAHRDDPLADCTVTEAGYGAMTHLMRRVGEVVGAPVGFVLEGGYDLAALAGSVATTLEALQAPLAPPSVGRCAEATDARRRLAQWWPALAT